MTSNIYEKNDNFYKKKEHKQLSIKMKIFRSTKNKRKHEERKTQQSISIKMISFKKEREKKMKCWC